MGELRRVRIAVAPKSIAQLHLADFEFQGNGQMATSTIPTSTTESTELHVDERDSLFNQDDVSLTYKPQIERVDAEDIFQRIDETLELIAEAQAIDQARTPVGQIDISIIIPVRNARETLPEVLERIEEVMPTSCEVIVVDDASTDGSWHYVRSMVETSNITLLRRKRSHGRGSAIRMALRHTTGRVVAIQDADMAYDPADLLGAIWPILENQADAVYGSRRLRRDTRCGVGMVARLSNRVTTLAANLTTGLKLSDLESSHKAFRGDLIRSIDLRECDRGFDAEITAKIARRAKVVMEVPTSFEGDLLDKSLAPSWMTFLQTFVGLVRYRTA